MQQELLVVLEEVVILSCEGPELLDAHQQQVVVRVLCVRLPQQPLHTHMYDLHSIFRHISVDTVFTVISRKRY